MNKKFKVLGINHIAFATSDISKTDILTHCIKNLERFKVPAKIEFVEDFPRTDYGKIKRFMLK